MESNGVEIEIQVPCAEGQTHPVRLRFTGWGEYKVAYNPCEELLGPVFARMAACTHYLHEQFPEAFRKDTSLKRRLVEALGAAGALAVPTLIQALGDWNWDVRRAAAKALGKLGDLHAVPALSVWAHAGEDAAHNALQALGHPALDLPQAVAQVAVQGAWGVLIRALPSEKVREAMAGLGAPAVPVLIKALGDDWYGVRRAACEALGAIGDLQAVPALIKALGDRDKDVRRAACEALGAIGDPQAVPALIKALGDRDEDVRRAAAEALVKIGTPAVPALHKALTDKSQDFCRRVCEVLGAIGDASSLEPLHSLRQRYPELEREIEQAIERIEAYTAWLCEASAEVEDAPATDEPELPEQWLWATYDLAEAAAVGEDEEPSEAWAWEVDAPTEQAPAEVIDTLPKRWLWKTYSLAEQATVVEPAELLDLGWDVKRDGEVYFVYD